MTLVGVGKAAVRDDDRPVCQVACGARGGFDGDVGSDADEHEVVDPCHSENDVERGAFEPAGPLPPDDRVLRLGATSSMTSVAEVFCSRVGLSMRVPNSGEFGVTPGSPGWYATKV